MAINWTPGLQEVQQGTQGYVQGAQNIQNALERQTQVVGQAGQQFTNTITKGIEGITQGYIQGRQQARADEQLQMDHQRLENDNKRLTMEQNTNALNMDRTATETAQMKINNAHTNAAWTGAEEAAKLVAEKQKITIPEGASAQAAVNSTLDYKAKQQNLVKGQKEVEEINSRMQTEALNRDLNRYKTAADTANSLLTNPYIMNTGSRAHDMYNSPMTEADKTRSDEDKKAYPDFHQKANIIQNTHKNVDDVMKLMLGDKIRPSNADGTWDSGQIKQAVFNLHNMDLLQGESAANRQRIAAKMMNLEVENRAFKGGNLSSMELEQMNRTAGGGVIAPADVINTLGNEGFYKAIKEAVVGGKIEAINLQATLENYQQNQVKNKEYLVTQNINGSKGLKWIDKDVYTNDLWNTIPEAAKKSAENPQGIAFEEFSKRNRSDQARIVAGRTVNVAIPPDTIQFDDQVDQMSNFGGIVHGIQMDSSQIKDPSLRAALDMKLKLLNVRLNGTRPLEQVPPKPYMDSSNNIPKSSANGQLINDKSYESAPQQRLRMNPIKLMPQADNGKFK